MHVFFIFITSIGLAHTNQPKFGKWMNLGTNKYILALTIVLRENKNQEHTWANFVQNFRVETKNSADWLNERS